MVYSELGRGNETQPTDISKLAEVEYSGLHSEVLSSGLGRNVRHGGGEIDDMGLSDHRETQRRIDH